MEQLLLHGLGDYLIQNDWMALNKKKLSIKGELACQIHCITYALPFLLIGSWIAVLFIYISHYIIDRSNIVAYFLAIRNGAVYDGHKQFPGSRKYNIENFGFGKERPFPITIWLYIITDNIFHLICNYFLLKYL